MKQKAFFPFLKSLSIDQMKLTNLEVSDIMFKTVPEEVPVSRSIKYISWL